MTYSRSELDAMTLDAAIINAEADAQCPIAATMRNTADDELAWHYDAQQFGERYALLARVSVACHDRVLEGRDLQHDGLQDAADVAQVLQFAREFKQ